MKKKNDEHIAELECDENEQQKAFDEYTNHKHGHFSGMHY